jgi:hypothetical protein
MATKAGVGFSNKTSSKEAGAEAAKAAVAQMGAGKTNMCMIFTTSKHDPAAIRDGVRSVIGNDAQIAGGYAVGIITKDHLGYGGYEVGVATISSDQVKFELLSESGLGNGGELEVGTKLGKKIRGKGYDSKSGMVLMYDSVRGQAASLLNMATPILEGMNKELQGKWPALAGVGLLGDMQFQPTKQWLNDELVSQTAMALMTSGDVRMDTIIMHGCKPSSGYHKITKTDGAIVLEIDNKPALDVIAELLGSDKRWEEYPLFVTLGVNRGDKFEDFKEDNYANRLCMSIDKERKGLVMFEPDLKPGDEVQLMRRDINFDYIGKRAHQLFESLGDRKAFFAIYIDCAGRASAYCGTDKEEAAEVQKVIGSKMPLLGMYSGVEVAKVGPAPQALDWTGVLAVFSTP